MLQAFRERSGTLFVKLLFGFLVASFALWGVGDIFQGYTSGRPVASVKGGSISQEDFVRNYQRVIHHLQSLSKGKLSPQQIREMKIHQHVLDEQINTKILDTTIQEMNLIATDHAIRSQIQSTLAFKNDQGKFDKGKFDALLANNGLTEEGVIGETRKNLCQKQLLNTVAMGDQLPSFYQKILFQALHQERVFLMMTLPLTHISISQTPTQEELEHIYKANQPEFTWPEYRKLSFLKIALKEIAARVHVTPLQLEEAYQSRKINFIVPEKRDITQLLFPSDKDAKAAYDDLNKGHPILIVIQKYGAKVHYFKQATQAELTVDHGKVVFEQKEGGVSLPIESVFGATLFITTKVFPEYTKDFETVKSSLEEEIRKNQASEILYDLKNKIEDDLATGESLEEIAKKHQLSLVTLEGIDKEGKDSAKKQQVVFEEKETVLETIFSLPEGGMTNMMETGAGESIVVHIDHVTPQSIPDLSVIKDQVTARWKEMKKQEKGSELAQKIVSLADSPQKFTQLAKENGGKVVVLPPLNRLDLEMKSPSLGEASPLAIHQGFSLKPNQATYVPDSKGFTLIMLQEEKGVDFDQEKLTSFLKEMDDKLKQDLQKSYVGYLRQNGQVSVNEEAMNHLLDRE